MVDDIRTRHGEEVKKDQVLIHLRNTDAEVGLNQVIGELAIALERRGESEAALAGCAEAEAVLASWAGWRRRLAVVAARDTGGAEVEWIRRRERLSRRRRRGREAALPLAGSA